MIKKLAFLLLFVALVFVFSQIELSKIWGTEGQMFTLYEFLGPLPMAFLGPVFGAVAIIFARGADLLLNGAEFTLFDIARVFTMVFAAWYFVGYKKNYAMLAIPVIAMAMFFLHPVGSQVWYYALYWLIPIAAFFVRENLWLRSLGTSFTAHAVGSIAFLYTFGTSPEMWLMLIPIVAIERIVFATGIAASYVSFNTMLNKYFSKDKTIAIDKKYSLS